MVGAATELLNDVKTRRNKDHQHERSKVTCGEAQSQIGRLPSLGSCPNIRNLGVAFFARLEGIPLQQSHEYGYKGMAQQHPEFALVSNVPWVPFPDPGNHHVINAALNA